MLDALIKKYHLSTQEFAEAVYLVLHNIKCSGKIIDYKEFLNILEYFIKLLKNASIYSIIKYKNKKQS